MFELHEVAVRNYCLRRLPVDEAADATAEVFLTAWRRIDEVDTADELLPWLYGVARNVVRNANRSSSRRYRLMARLGGLSPAHDPGPEAQVLRRTEDQLVITALDGMGEADREVLRLHIWEGLTRRQLGQVFGITEAAVGMRLTRAKRRMEKRLKAVGYAPTEVASVAEPASLEGDAT